MLQPNSPMATETTSNACLSGENSSAIPGTYTSGSSTANTKSATYTTGASRNVPASVKKIFSANDRTFFMRSVYRKDEEISAKPHTIIARERCEASLQTKSLRRFNRQHILYNHWRSFHHWLF